MKKAGLIILLTVYYLSAYTNPDSLTGIGNEPEYFPNSINNKWKYEISYPYGDKIDTVIVTIREEKIILGKTYKIWEYVFNTGKEFMYCSVSNDTVRFISPANNEVIQMFLIPFEFELNNSWYNTESHYDRDKVTVKDIQDVVIKDKKYSDAIFIERNASARFNDIYSEHIWFKPYLGLLKIRMNQRSLGPGNNETWKLIEYSIK